ncbi:MAG: zf-HC2 domain-containing protein [Deltaproteobacteria bacterium]|nr:zf-HC2 domain-containing protein [Deltaproteobacteria bacterium]
MECEAIRQYLSEYVDGALDDETRTLVDKHLPGCKGCREELEALKSLVSELGSIESVEPPEDFLDQLHARMDRPSCLSRIMRKLFVPMRIKIPLELAGAVAVLVLVFSIFNLQQGQLNVGGPADRLKQEGLVEEDIGKKGKAKAPLTMVQGDIPGRRGAAEDKVSAPRSAYEAEVAESPLEQGAPIELVLVMRRKMPGEVPEPLRAKKAYRVREKAAESFLELEKCPAPASSERIKGKGEPVSELEALIGQLGGRIISIEREGAAGRSEVVNAEIPSAQVSRLYEELKLLGDLKVPPEAKAGKGKEVLQIRIRILPSE